MAEKSDAEGFIRVSTPCFWYAYFVARRATDRHALLKIIAWVDDPYQRAKDLQDIRMVLRRYEHESGRLFSDAVFDADLPDFEFANAFLLGVDMRAMATGDDARFVDQFLGRLLAQDEEGQFDDESDFNVKSFRGQIRASGRASRENEAS